MNEVVEAHYIHKAYLDKFGFGPKKNLKVFCYHKQEEKTFPISTRKIARAKHFYNIPGDKSQFVEKLWIKTIEDNGIKALDELLGVRNVNYIKKHSRADIAAYAVLTWLRTPHARFRWVERFQKLLKPVMDRMLELKGYPGHSIRMKPLGLKAMHINDLVQSVDEFAPIIHDMEWILLFNKSRTPYYTSDNPINIYNHKEPENPWKSNLGLLCEGIQLFWPISPDVLLNLTHPKITPLLRLTDSSRISIYSEKKIEFYNQFQVGNSTKYIFSTTNDFKFASDLLARKPIFKLPYNDQFDTYIGGKKNDTVTDISEF